MIRDDAVIDVQAHIFPREAIELADSGKTWYGSTIELDKNGAPVLVTGSSRAAFSSTISFESVETRLKNMDEAGVDVQVLSVLPPFFKYFIDAETAIAGAQAINNDIADLCQTWPDRFVGLATLPLQDPEASIRELDRVMELGLVGVMIGKHVDGKDLDDPALFPVLEAMSEHRAFVYIHPIMPRKLTGSEDPWLDFLLGGYWDSAAAMCALMFGGVLDRLPDLTVCFSHGGGMGPYAMGRIERGWRSKPEEHSMKTPPREFLERMYFDSFLRDDRALRFLVDTVGAKQVVLGTDYGSSADLVAQVSAVTESPLLSQDEKQAIAGTNLFGILKDLGHLPA